MPVPTARTDLSTTAASNSPAGSEAIGTNADDYIRAGFKFQRENYDDIQLRQTIAAPSDFTGATNCTVVASGTSGYGAFTAKGSGTGDSYVFFYNATNGERARIKVDNTRGMYFSVDGGSTNAITIAGTTNRVTIDADGDATSNVAALSLVGSYGGGLKLADSGGNIDAMVYTQSGQFVIGMTTSGGASQGAQFVMDRATGDAAFSGTVTTPDVIETSAREVKDNIVAAESGALDRILALSVKEFEFRADGSRRKRVGVIADEVSSRYSVNGQGVSLTNLLFDLVKAVQELAAK
jgi:hypothetical protein